MKKPVIGVTPLFDDKLDSMWMLPRYMNAVRQGGGIPVMLPFTESEREIEQLAQIFDGFLFTGGQDIDPKYYGQEKLDCCNEPSAYRDVLEKILFKTALRRKKPILGICRGIQLINVMLGGTLYQDIDTQTKPEIRLVHSQEKPYDAPAHSVRLSPGTPLRALEGMDEIMVNSLHHQAVLKLGRGLKTAATAPDGIIEAVYMPDERFVLGIQWHPEYMFTSDSLSALIFKDFVDACS